MPAPVVVGHGQPGFKPPAPNGRQVTGQQVGWTDPYAGDPVGREKGLPSRMDPRTAGHTGMFME